MPLRSTLFLLCGFLWPALAQDAAPPAETLLRSAIEAQKAQDAHNWKFTFREDDESVPTDKNGKPDKPTHRTYDNIMLEGDLYKKLVLIEGQPPDAKTQKKIDAEMEKARAERKAHPQIRSHEVRMGGLEQLDRMCDSKVTGQETIDGRAAWRIESLPKAEYKPANEEEKRLMAVKRITWIDAREFAQLRELDIFFQSASGFEPGSEIETTLAKFGDAWVLATMSLRYKAKVRAVLHVYGEANARFYDYKKFTAESKIIIE